MVEKKANFLNAVLAGAGGSITTRWHLMDVNGRSYDSGDISIPLTGITGYDIVVAAKILNSSIPTISEMIGADLIYQSGNIYANMSGNGSTFTGAAYGGTLPAATTDKTISGATYTNWISFGKVG